MIAAVTWIVEFYLLHSSTSEQLRRSGFDFYSVVVNLVSIIPEPVSDKPELVIDDRR